MKPIVYSLLVIAIALASVGVGAIRFQAQKTYSAGDNVCAHKPLANDGQCEAAYGKCVDSAKCDCLDTEDFVPFKCGGGKSRKCCKGKVSPRSGSLAAKTVFPEGKNKKICLTFNGGPFPITLPILHLLEELKVKAAFFINCHSGDHVVAAVKKMISDDHLIGNHMCSDDIKTHSDYKKYYKIVSDIKCLAEPAKSLFIQNVKGTFENYPKSDYGVLGTKYFSRPDSAFKVIRFPGEGRSQKCLIESIQSYAIASELSLTPSFHAAWHYEIAPTASEEAVSLKYPSDVPGLSTSSQKLPEDGDIVLANLHSDKAGRLTLLKNWITYMQEKKYDFVALSADGSCKGAVNIRTA